MCPGIRRTSLRNYLERARQVGLGWPLPEKLDAAELASWAMIASMILNLDETITAE